MQKSPKPNDPIAKRLLRTVFPPSLLVKLRPAYLTREVVNKKSRREQSMGALSALVNSGDFVADLGASIGVFALEFSELVGPSGKVFSFEPIAGNFKILEGVVRKAKLKNVKLYHAAVGAKAGHREMVIPKAEGFSGFYTAHFARESDDGNIEDHETVETFTLDDLWRNNAIPKLDFIKADVAGAELEVITGAKSLITKMLPGLLIGVSRRTGEHTFDALKQLGYRPFLYSDRLAETEHYLFENTYHYFFLHPDTKCWERAVSHGLFGAPTAAQKV